MRTETRIAARALVLTPTERVLLLNMELPWAGRVWMVPGGGVEAGETLPEAARRELHEETGALTPEIGPEIWRRHVSIEHGGRHVRLREHYFLVRTPEFEPTMHGLQDEELDWFLGFGWWTPAELAGTTETLAPPELAAGVGDLIREGPPRFPRELGAEAHAASA